ncbi:unnamed protein product [Macrosiphum euphorbiae]|uniref:SWIM-type domain-containing protein n=2 Tax=Macrosiphum euphorbiae TaxID=13131 RepID=A0AAV0Y520_9HEMI|nr:unnamed protein product [Macrosiphum euphorbiae]
MILKLTSDNLPSSFKNIITVINDDITTIRSNVNDLLSMANWIEEFSFKTCTKWNVRTSVPNGKYIQCRKQYVCHHSSYHKVDRENNKRGRSKNTSCKATIKIVIKVDTVSTRKTDPFVKDGLLAVITIFNEHNHNLNTAEALRYLSANKHIRMKFEEYFTDGMTITEAIRYHESVLTISDCPVEVFANAGINPTYRTIQNWHDQWRVLNLGPRTGEGVMKKLEEKKETYAESGVSIFSQSEPFAVLILTPIMKRAHDLPLSKKIVFVDSTSSCDPQNHCVTFLLTPCAAGAAPLGVIITHGQSEKAYKSGFSLIKNNVKNAFGGQGYPSIFLTDNSDAEINALMTVWPNSTSLLCIFHVMQAVWRWLWDSKNSIKKEHRTIMMQAFRKMLYSDTTEEAQKAFNSTLDAGSMYPKWQKYVIVHHWEHKERWCLAWRDHTTRGHHTNNYSEVFLLHKIGRILKKKILEFSNDRKATARLYFESIIKKSNYVTKDKIIVENEHYYVPSQNDQQLMYCVEPSIGICSCKEGMYGRFCKHQGIIYVYYKCVRVNFPPITVEDKFAISKLVLGDKAPCKTFYEGLIPKEALHQQLETHPIHLPISETHGPDVNNIPENNYNITKKNVFKSTTVPNEDSLISNTQDSYTVLEDIKTLLTNNVKQFSQSTLENLLKFKNRLDKVKTEGQFNTFLATAGSEAIPLRRREGAAIRLQPTTISRRRPGITRGSKRLPSGRPALSDHGTSKKKPRKLLQNIKHCLPNGKSH